MGIRCFKKENLHFVWDDSLVGKKVLVADSLGSLYEKLEDDESLETSVVCSRELNYPFLDTRCSAWRLAYVLEPVTDNSRDSEVKQAFLQGHTIVRRFANGEWESMSETSYFDLPGYEYKVSDSDIPLRVSNLVLAMWLAGGNGLLLEPRLKYISTTHTFPGVDIDREVPEGYKVMPIGGSEWLEPTTDVCVVKGV